MIARAPRLSAVVIAQDEEARLGPCLDSLAFADEVVLVDGGSRDGTVALARARAPHVRVVEAAFRGYGSARERGRREARGEWVLAVDADERVPAALAVEIRARLGAIHATGGDEPLAAAAARGGPDAFRLAIKTYYRDRWLRHGGFWPARRVRLFRREQARYAEGREVHERVEVQAAGGGAPRIDDLDTPLEHRSYGSFGEALRRVERYSTMAAAELHARGARAGAWRAALHGTARFLRGYLWRGGFLDGVPGLWFAALGGYEALAKYAKLWELGTADVPALARKRAAAGEPIQAPERDECSS
ncbi:MAG TPA: glycosyltransferase family 2 protein [Myxococcota bacterium]|jgi:glycosyltransferase involved in cell wall biosynthesis|nr:glycosyltransferase family 2 protein [Myxococcota bacterium]